MERFWVGQFQYKQKAQKIIKFQWSQGRQKNEGFSPRTYIAQTFIPKTSTILYSVTKGISKIYQLKREFWLSEVLQIHQSSVIHSFIIIHSLMSENDKDVPSIVCDFHTKWGKRDKLKRRFQGFISEILRVVGPLGENFIFLNSFGTTKISRSLRLSVYINVVLLINFLEQFKLFFYFKYWRSYKVL